MNAVYFGSQKNLSPPPKPAREMINKDLTNLNKKTKQKQNNKRLLMEGRRPVVLPVTRWTATRIQTPS